MKKLLSLTMTFLLALFLVLSTSALAGENYALFSDSSDVDIPKNEHLAGDANGDGVVNLVDAIATLRYCVGNYNNTLRDGVDSNNDGEVNPIDVIVVLLHVLGDDVGLGVVVNADGSVKEENSAAQSEENTLEIAVVTAVANGDISALEVSGDGVFLGWFTTEDAAKALDTNFAAVNDYAGDVFGAYIDTEMAFVGVDMLTKAPYGIRFVSKLDKNTITAIETVNDANRSGKSGTFTPANEWKNGIGYGTALAIDVAVDGIAEKASGMLVNGGMCVPAVYAYGEDDSAISFTATVIGVDVAEMADKIAARPYITYMDANGNEHTVYANGDSESFYNVTFSVANGENATEDEKTAATALLTNYSGGAFATKSTIEQFNLSSEKGSADNDNAYVELDRSTLVALNETNNSRFQNAFYPRITRVRDDLYLMTFNYSQLGQHIYWTTSKDGKNWGDVKVLYGSSYSANKFEYESGSLAGKSDMYYGTTADHVLLDDGTVMCVYSRRPCSGYRLAEYASINTIEMIVGTVSGDTIKWSKPVPIYRGQNWEPEIIQRENGDIEVYWSHAAPMIQKYGFDDDMRSSGVAMVSSTDGGKTWSPVSGEENLFSGKRIYQYNAGKFTLDSGKTVNFYHGQMPGVVELADGRMMVVGETRTTSRSYHMISAAWSNKDGTWTELGIDQAGPKNVKEDNFKGAAPTLMRFDSGEVLLTYNSNGTLLARVLDKAGNNVLEAYENNALETVIGEDSGFWSASAPVDSHTAIISMCYTKYNGLTYTTTTTEEGKTKNIYNNTTLIGQVKLNHTIDATKKNMVADGNLQEWKNITDALFVGSLSDVQATYRFAYDNDYIYVAIDRTDALADTLDTNYVMVATKGGFVKAVIGGESALPTGVTGGAKNADGGSVYELCFDRAALGLTGDYIRVCPGFTDAANGVDDMINGTVADDTSSWIKINLK